jgi:hypothetical protein
MKTLGNPPPGIQASGSGCAVRRRAGSCTAVLGGKGPLRRVKYLAPLPPARRCARGSFATDGSAGNQMRGSFIRLEKDEIQVVLTKHHRRFL